MKFMSWNFGDKFWVKHNESVCLYTDDDYKYFGSDQSNQLVSDWMKKKYIINMIKYESLDYEQVYNALRRYLYFKGDYSTLKTFKEYIFYLNYFKNIKLKNQLETDTGTSSNIEENHTSTVNINDS